MLVTMRIITRPLFFSGLSSAAKSFIGLPGAMKLWQCSQPTPSAWATPCMMGTTCWTVYSLGST